MTLNLTFPIKAVVTDIEGTTSSISFVKETLFPLAFHKMGEFLTSHSKNPQIVPLLNQIQQTLQQENISIVNREDLVSHIRDWINRDLKHPALKELQGFIWESSFQTGEIKADIYPDVLPLLQKWHAAGLILAIYSSGSVFAQKLFFKHTIEGDITPLFSNFFDNKIGYKQDITAYLHIAEVLNFAPWEILFLSDVTQELDAARLAGFQTVHIVRPGTEASMQHFGVSSFEYIHLD